ncbi:inositol monophosphatase family protein [Streptomyces sp. SID4985]|uniref:inositol monophosphatase family protein n=1 Tax=Streptomyces sp. SID4985 TaxID=2690292 RepID=UPI00136EE5E1
MGQARLGLLDRARPLHPGRTGTPVGSHRRRKCPERSHRHPATSVQTEPAGSGTCHGALLVATGQVDAFLLLGAGPWDIAPLIPIVQEAGGTFSDLAGQHRTDTGAALFARPGLHQQRLDIAVVDKP